MRIFWLFLAGVASLFAMSVIDGAVFTAFSSTAPVLSVLADVRLPSLLVFSLAAWRVVPTAAFRPPTGPVSRRLVVACVAWLIGALVSVHGLGGWSYQAERPADFVAFLLTGLLCEELLFRGVLFDLGRRALGGNPSAIIPRWVWFSSICFGLSHLQFHGFALTQPALFQIATTIPLGILLGLLRERSGSLALPIGFHLVNNLLFAVH